jgi:hypothetical protein
MNIVFDRTLIISSGDDHPPIPGIRIMSTGSFMGVRYVIAESPLTGPHNPNGYIRLPDGHPWSHKDPSDIEVDVHGGITYGPVEGWIGFDTAHWSDDMGALDPRNHHNPIDDLFPYIGPDPSLNQWNEDKVRDEVKHLITQIVYYE